MKVNYILIIVLTLVQTISAQTINPLIIAHRGASGDAPENTVASANLAWEYNADAVEIDIHLSKDQKVMVHHDASTKRICNKDLIIKNTASKQLRKLDAGSFKDDKYSGEKIPFLSEVIETVPVGKKLVVEIKSGIDVVDQMAKVIDASGKLDQMIFISFHFDAIVKAKQLFPNNKSFFLIHSLSDDYASLFQKVKDNKLDGVDLNYKLIDETVKQTAQNMDLELHCYTVNDAAIAKDLAKLGVHSITTDFPKKMTQAIAMKSEFSTK